MFKQFIAAVFVEMTGCIGLKTNFKLRWIKLLPIFLLYPAIAETSTSERFDPLPELNLKKRNILVNIVINKLIAYIRHIIMQGSPIVGIPVLDPFKMEDFHYVIPAGLFDLDLRLKNISVIGFGGFIMNKNILHLSNLTFEMEVYLPRVVISAETMHINEIVNDFISAIPITYNKDKTELEMDNFRLQANLHLKQSDDEKSILIEKIEKAFFDIPSFKMNTNGVIDREHIELFSGLEEVLVENVNSCKEAIIKIISDAILTFGNPVLNRLDTWRYINVLI